MYSSGVDRLPPYPLACITLALVQTPVLAPVQETVRDVAGGTDHGY